MSNFEEQAQLQILAQLLECNSACADVNSFEFKIPEDDLGRIEFLLKTLPGAEYINSQLVNYIFSNGLTTGLVDQDAKLEEFLYRNNDQEATNYSVLRDAVGLAASYGECGIRWYEGNIYLLRPGTYAPLTTREDGVEKVVAYITRKDGKYLGRETFKISDIDFGEETTELTDIVERFFEESSYLLLDKTEFVNLRNKTASLHGESPFLKDELRVKLLTTAYERLIHDLNYEGPGRVFFWTKDGYVGDEINDISTSSVMNQSQAAQISRESKAQTALETFAKEFKGSKTDSVGVVPSVFSKDYAHFPKVTKATEFFDWIGNEGVILSQVFGMSPSLLELGALSGNVSMEKIIDDAMLNKIVPLRENYAIQFSSFLAGKLGLVKVYFDKYELKQAEDENTMRTKIVNIMSILNSIKDENNVTRPDCAALVEDFGQMLWNDIHHENRQLKELKLGTKESEKNEHERNRGASGERETDYGEERRKGRFL